MAYALYRGTRLGLALQEALGEMEEYEQISPNVRTAVLRKFDEVLKNNEAGFENFESHPSNQSLCLQTMCEKLEKEVDSRLTIRAERLWSFRFCDSVSRQYLNFNHES